MISALRMYNDEELVSRRGISPRLARRREQQLAKTDVRAGRGYSVGNITHFSFELTGQSMTDSSEAASISGLNSHIFYRSSEFCIRSIRPASFRVKSLAFTEYRENSWGGLGRYIGEHSTSAPTIEFENAPTDVDLFRFFRGLSEYCNPAEISSNIDVGTALALFERYKILSESGDSIGLFTFKSYVARGCKPVTHRGKSSLQSIIAEGTEKKPTQEKVNLPPSKLRKLIDRNAPKMPKQNLLAKISGMKNGQAIVTLAYVENQYSTSASPSPPSQIQLQNSHSDLPE